MRMRTVEEVDMEIKEEVRAIMETAAIETQEDMTMMMKTMMRIITRMTKIMTMKKMMIEAREEEVAEVVLPVVPAEGLVL